MVSPARGWAKVAENRARSFRMMGRMLGADRRTFFEAQRPRLWPPGRGARLDGRCLSFLVAALAGVTASCGESDADEPTPSFSACDGEQFTICDILEARCQDAILSTMECLREQPVGAPPPTRTISAEQYRAELEAATAEQTNPDGTQIAEQALVSLGLASTGDFTAQAWVDLNVETVPAYYSSLDDSVTFVVSDEVTDPGSLMVLLAHEYVHFLQDQTVDLVAFRQAAATTDADFASTSVIEGEAEMLSTFFASALWGLDDTTVDYRSRFTSWVDRVEEQLADESPLLATPRYFPYSFGARYVYNVYEQGGIPAVRDLFDTPPAGTLPVLLSERSVSDVEVDPMADLSFPPPLDGFALAFWDTLGAWVYGKFLAHGDPAHDDGQMAHWRGDRLVVYVDSALNVVVLWRLRLDAEQAAENLRSAFAQDFPVAPSRGGVLLDGRDVILVTTSAGLDEQTWISRAGGPWDAPLPEPTDVDTTENGAAKPPSLAQVLRPRWRRHGVPFPR